MDASALAELSACGVEAARKMGREKSFQMSDVLRQLEANYPDSDGAIDWADLGKDVSVFFRRIPKLDAMNGAFKIAKKKKKRTRCSGSAMMTSVISLRLKQMLQCYVTKEQKRTT